MTEAQAEQLEAWCREVKLTSVEREITLAWVDGLPVNKIAIALSLQRHQVKAHLGASAAKFRRRGFALGEDEREFARDLLHCVANRAGENLRQSGVTPNRDVLTSFPAARLVPADHPAVCGTPATWLRSWAWGL